MKAATGSEYEKTVTVKGSEPDSSLTVQISSDGKKFRATIEIESNKSKPCSGTIGSDGKIKSEECEIPSIMNGYSTPANFQILFSMNLENAWVLL